MMTKHLFVGGKGGVGKTTMASALALANSTKGKTLLVSTDPVFALSDLWGVKLSNKPKRLRKNLFAKHINPDFYKGKTTSSPCASEKAALAEFSTHLLSEEFDTIVYDTAPTGHTLQLLRKPKEWKELVEKAPLACGAENGDEAKYTNVIHKIGSNDTTFNFVLIPEALSIQETKRAVSELAGIGLKRFTFTVNMVIPPSEVGNNPFLKKRLEMQRKHIVEINKAFGCCHKLVYLQDSEIKGEARLEKVASQLFAGCC